MSVVKNIKNTFYKKGTNEVHIGKLIMIVVVFAGVILFGIFKEDDLKRKSRERKLHLRYTIAITGKQHKNFKSSTPKVDYYYYYYRGKYSGSSSVYEDQENTLITNGGRYYVEFSSKNPKNSKLLLSFPVPDSVTDAPDSGWQYMPGYRNAGY